EKRSCFRQEQTSFAVHRAKESLRNAAPQIDRKAVAGANYILGAYGKIHRQRTGVRAFLPKHVQSETLRMLRGRNGLDVQVIERRRIRIGIWPVHHANGIECRGREFGIGRRSAWNLAFGAASVGAKSQSIFWLRESARSRRRELAG